MATSLLMIRKLVRDRLGVPMHDDFFTDQLIDANINLAILAVEEQHRWPWNEISADLVLAAGASSATVPADWRATRAITLGTNVLEEATPYDLDRHAQSVGAGIPGYYAVYGLDKIRFAPTGGAEQTFQHYYYRDPKLLDTDEDTIRMPSVHVGTVVAKASQLCSVREDDRPSAESHMLEFLAGIEMMRKDTRRSTRPTAIRIRAGSWV